MFNDKKKLTMPEMTGKDPDDNTPAININNLDDDPQNDIISLMAINELTKDKKTTSRIKPEQVPTLVKLYAFSSVFKTSFTKRLADNIMQIQVSINGLGRREYVNLVQRRMDQIQMERPISSKDIFR